MFEREPQRVAFYRSHAWEATRAAYMASVNHICERCGRPAKIVHHRYYIDGANVSDPSVTLSMGNLEALCQECHNREHFGNGMATAPGLRFTADGELIADLTTE